MHERYDVAPEAPRAGHSTAGNVGPIALQSVPAFVISSRNFSTWIDRYLSVFPAPYPIVAIGTGLAIYLAGLGLTFAYGFHPVYLQTFAVYVWTLAIIWTTAVAGWATSRTRRMLVDLRPVFLETDETYDGVIRRLSARCLSAKVLIFIVPVSVLSLYVAMSDAYNGSLYPFRFSVYPSMRNLPGDWYSSHRAPNLVLLSVFGVVITVLLVSAIWYLIAYMRFLFDIGRFKTVPIPGVIMTKCRPVANFGLAAFYMAFVGVGMYVVLARDDLDRYTVLLVALLAIVFTSPSIVPQMIFHRFLANANRDVADIGLLLYRECARPGSAVLNAAPSGGPPRDAAAELATWSSLTSMTTPAKEWIYDFSQVFLLVVGQLVTAAATLASVYLRQQL